MVTALLEGGFRDDVAWRPFATIVTVGLAPVLLWRRTHPLACVVAGFGTGMGLGLGGPVGGVPGGGLQTEVFHLGVRFAPCPPGFRGAVGVGAGGGGGGGGVSYW